MNMNFNSNNCFAKEKEMISSTRAEEWNALDNWICLGWLRLCNAIKVNEAVQK